MTRRLVDALAPGLRVWVPTLSNESARLAEELRLDPERARGVVFAGVQFPGIDRIDYLGVHPEARDGALDQPHRPLDLCALLHASHSVVGSPAGASRNAPRALVKPSTLRRRRCPAGESLLGPPRRGHPAAR